MYSERRIETDAAEGDDRIPLLIEAARLLGRGQFEIKLPPASDDGLGRLSQALRDLGQALRVRQLEGQRLADIVTRINAGRQLNEILEAVYSDFHLYIPYNRIGLALLDRDHKVLRAIWQKSDLPETHLLKGYSAVLAGSSLAAILATGQPRIINDLEEYLRGKPGSQSTRLIVQEGLRSSLTCPLIANGQPVGFVFFSSTAVGAYSPAHIEVFKQIADQLAVSLERGRLIAELEARQAEIEAQNAELRRLNDVKDNFLGMAAHDLRNPLTAILLTTSALLDPAFAVNEQERRLILGDVETQANYMLTLLYDLLDVSQIESGHLNLRVESIHLADFLDEAVKRHAKLAKPKGIGVMLDSVTAGYVAADPLRLRQVLDNLISNAVKFTPADQAVRVRAALSNDCWRISVEDAGPGITRADRERMFQPFARLSARPTGGEKSTGLGLAITRRIVEAQGGQIGVESEPGRGATFWFTLPPNGHLT